MSVLHFFDQLEDRIRSRLSHSPIIYGIVGGVALVLFWRGMWMVADMLAAQGGSLGWWFSAPVSLVVSMCVLLLTGLFVSFFIGDRIILSGLTHEKKIEEKTEMEVRAEGTLLVDIYKKIEKIEKDIDAFKAKIL